MYPANLGFCPPILWIVPLCTSPIMKEGIENLLLVTQVRMRKRFVKVGLFRIVTLIPFCLQTHKPKSSLGFLSVVRQREILMTDLG